MRWQQIFAIVDKRLCHYNNIMIKYVNYFVKVQGLNVSLVILFLIYLNEFLTEMFDVG